MVFSGAENVALRKPVEADSSRNTMTQHEDSLVDGFVPYLDPIRKAFRMGVFSVRCSVFRRGLGCKRLLSWPLRGQRPLIGLSLA